MKLPMVARQPGDSEKVILIKVEIFPREFEEFFWRDDDVDWNEEKKGKI